MPLSPVTVSKSGRGVGHGDGDGDEDGDGVVMGCRERENIQSRPVPSRPVQSSPAQFRTNLPVCREVA